VIVDINSHAFEEIHPRKLAEECAGKSYSFLGLGVGKI
jgi:hypothetical protein